METHINVTNHHEDSAMKTLDILLADNQNFRLPPDISSLLSPSSQRRLAQISTEVRRRQFMLGRWLIAQAAGCELASIADTASYPHFPEHPDWHASISHSGPYVASIVSKHARYGLDIEYPMRSRDWPALAERAFSQPETAWILAAPPEEQAERFYRIWTLREAAFKAGMLTSVVGQEPVFDPASDQPVAHGYWRYRQHDGIYLSVVGPECLEINLHEIALPD